MLADDAILRLALEIELKGVFWLIWHKTKRAQTLGHCNLYYEFASHISFCAFISLETMPFSLVTSYLSHLSYPYRS